LSLTIGFGRSAREQKNKKLENRKSV